MGSPTTKSRSSHHRGQQPSKLPRVCVGVAPAVLAVKGDQSPKWHVSNGVLTAAVTLDEKILKWLPVPYHPSFFITSFRHSLCLKTSRSRLPHWLIEQASFIVQIQQPLLKISFGSVSGNTWNWQVSQHEWPVNGTSFFTITLFTAHPGPLRLAAYLKQQLVTFHTPFLGH